MTSLAELREIEQERIASERAAIAAEALGQKRALIEAEQRAKDAAEAKLLAERTEEIRIAREREQAERAARMQVEAVEATERARLAAALEQERTVQELDLRRQEVAKKRPTWMVAVTIGAVLLAGALTWFGIDRYQQAEAANVQETLAKKEADDARRERDLAIERMDQMNGQLAELSKRVDEAIEQVIIADGVAARAAAKQNLDRLRTKEAEIKRQRDLEAARIAKIKRNIKVEISDACKKSALAKDCM